MAAIPEALLNAATACALASVGTSRMAPSRRCAVYSVRQLTEPGQHLGGAELAVAANAEHPTQDGVPVVLQASRRRQHDCVGQRAAQAWLLPVRQHVATDVDEHQRIALQPGRDP
jgi:hypothetical protein